MKVWITKYVLPQGLFETDVEPTADGGAFQRGDIACGTCGIYWRRDDWHETRDAAVARAEQMRDAKIRSYKARLAQLNALDFRVAT